MAAARRHYLARSIVYGFLLGLALGAALPVLLLPPALLLDELEVFGPRYGTPDVDIATLLITLLITVVGSLVGAVLGAVTGSLLGLVNGLLLLGLSHFVPQRLTPRTARLIAAGISALLTPPLMQALAHSLTDLHFSSDFLGIGGLFWLAGLIAGAGGWWSSGRLIQLVYQPPFPSK